jgi:hypothetical protein
MKLPLSLVVLGFSVAISQVEAADGPVDLGSVPTDEGTAPAAESLSFHLYADFDVDASLVSGSPVRWTFNQNHRELLLSASSGTGIDLMADAMLPLGLFGMGIPLSLPFSGLGDQTVLGSSRIWMGMLLVPFGEFSFHHLYGGRESLQSGLVPDLWSDAAVQWSLAPLPGMTADLYLSNGFTDPSQNFLGSLGLGGANEHPKAWALRLHQDLAPGWFISVSGFRDAYGADSEPSKVLWMGGLDLAARTGPLSYRISALDALVSGGTSDWTRWGWYGETAWALDRVWTLRLRGGTKSPDSRDPSLEVADLNVAALARTGPVEWDLTWFSDGPLPSWTPWADTVSHELLLKILFTL